MATSKSNKQADTEPGVEAKKTPKPKVPAKAKRSPLRKRRRK